MAGPSYKDQPFLKLVSRYPILHPLNHWSIFYKEFLLAKPYGTSNGIFAIKIITEFYQNNAIKIKWLVFVQPLSTLGAKCRSIFTHEIIRLFDTRTVPAKVKVAWNGIVKEVVGI